MCQPGSYQCGVPAQQNSKQPFLRWQQGQEPALCAFIILMTTKDQSAMRVASKYLCNLQQANQVTILKFKQRRKCFQQITFFYSYSHGKTIQTLEFFQLIGMWMASEDISSNYDGYHKSIRVIVISYMLRKVTTPAIIHSWQNKPKTELCHPLEMKKALTSRFLFKF